MMDIYGLQVFVETHNFGMKDNFLSVMVNLTCTVKFSMSIYNIVKFSFMHTAMKHPILLTVLLVSYVLIIINACEFQSLFNRTDDDVSQ
jgi:hypothetical protein